MKKTLISLAVLACASHVAFAQSSVTIYGIVDAGIVDERGGIAGPVVKVTSGVASASRIGFMGNEDLGNGLSAVFLLENGFRVDTGAQDATGIFARQAYVGLKSNDAGTVTLGRQYTPWYNTLSQVADPFGAGYAGTSKNLFAVNGVAANSNNNTNIRTSNTILYSSPVVSGLSAVVSYAAGESAVSNTVGRQMGAALAYANGPLNARLAYNNVSNNSATVTTASARNLLFAANYDFTVAKAFFAFGKDKGLNSSLVPVPAAYSTTAAIPSTDSTDLLVGATAPIGANGTLMASYIRKNDKTVNNQDADQYAIGFSQALSKRTSAYVAFAKIKNKNGASYTVGNNTENGTGDKAFNLGVRHSF